MALPKRKLAGSAVRRQPSGPTFFQILRQQWQNPELRKGNATVTLAFTVFAGTIAFLRNFGDLLTI